jgi:hypothetical protein
VTKVEGGLETRLVDDPVATLWSDGAGGLLFTYRWDSDVEEPWTIRQFPAGASAPIVAVRDYQGAFSVVNFDGRTAVVRYDSEDRCEDGSIGVYDLETGSRGDFVVCSGDGDVGWFPSTYGGGLFVGVRWDDLGSCRTISGILFWDRSGTDIEVATNPYPLHGWDESAVDWIPSEIDARISPDGRLLAYRFRPDNKWPCPEFDDVPYEDWLEESRKIPGVVVVLDIETGTEIFRTESEAEERLTDFDGQFLVLTTAERRWDEPRDELRSVEESTIVDITGISPDHVVAGRVRLIWTHN